MRIDTATSATTTTATATAASNLTGSRDEFLRLFVAQLENQNPLDPQSGADMVAQLAQFSGVEQQVETNRRLDILTAAQDAAGSAGLANLVGRTVTTDATTFEMDGAGTPPPVTFDSDGTVAGGEAVIKDANGREVARAPIVPGPPPSLAWDGRTAGGAMLPVGAYAIEVAATDAGGAPVVAHARFATTVDAVEFTSTGQRLHLGHARVSPGAVTTIAQGGPTP